MWYDLNLARPKRSGEPRSIKKFIMSLLDSGVPPSYAIWLGNRLPKYLWNLWGKDLKSEGLRWQDFLKCLSKFEGDIIKWVEGEVSWERLTSEIVSACQKGSGRGEGKSLLNWLRREAI